MNTSPEVTRGNGRIVASIVVGLLLTICSSRIALAQGATAGWKTLHDPHGISARCPAGWTIETHKTGSVEISASHHRLFVLIQPFLLREPGQSASDWLQQAAARFNPPFAGAQIDTVQGVGGSTDAAAAKMTFQTPDGKPAQANLLCGIQGKSGIFYAIAAPSDEFEGRKSTLLSILQSVHFTAPSGGVKSAARVSGAAGGVSFVSWRDPKEGAFSLQVPRGWTIAGGLYRSGPLDVRPFAHATSPDGAITSAVGTPFVQIFAEPTPMMDQLGFREGSPYSPGHGQQEIILHYMSGTEFAEMAVKKVIAKDDSNVEITKSEDLPLTEVEQRQLALLLAHGGSASRGMVFFSYRKDGHERVGACHVLTVRTPIPGVGALWGLRDLVVCTSPPDKFNEAAAVAGRMVSTFRLDPNWAKNENQIAYQTSQNITQEMDRFLKDTARPMENLIAGTVDLVDPSTGEKYQAGAGANYYWQSGGTIVGTQNYQRPGIGYSALNTW